MIINSLIIPIANIAKIPLNKLIYSILAKISLFFDLSSQFYSNFNGLYNDDIMRVVQDDRQDDNDNDMI